MRTFLVCCFLFLVYFTEDLPAQQIGIGASLGGGYISGDSPDIFSYSSSIFIDTYVFSNYVFPRLSFIYAAGIRSIIPGSRNTYSPFMKGYSLKAVVIQDFEDGYFIEEGAGLIYLNDRTFTFTNSWNYGVTFSLAGGLDLTDFYRKGFEIGISTEYAFTFSGTFPKFFSLHLQAKYVF